MRASSRSLTALSIILSVVTAIQCDVETSVGTIIGFVDAATPNVKQWLGVPFAEPPVNSLRFLPPVPKFNIGKINAQKPPPSCQQYRTTLPDIFNQAVPEFLPPGRYDEDCLYLNVVARQNPKSPALPVLVWIHGGMTTFGGINTPYEKPQKWVQRSQEHIVVQIK